MDSLSVQPTFPQLLQVRPVPKRSHLDGFGFELLKQNLIQAVTQPKHQSTRRTIQIVHHMRS